MVGPAGSRRQRPPLSLSLPLLLPLPLLLLLLLLFLPVRSIERVEVADHPQVVSFAETEPGIGLTKAAVKNSDLLITTDSGPRHFAAPFDVPVVTLFGPTHIAWSETFYPNSIHLQLDVDCGPCQKRVCPLQHHRCMTELSPERVFAAAQSLLDRQNKTASAA